MVEVTIAKQELRKRNSLVVASHQWLLGELDQIFQLVSGCRRKLCECKLPAVSVAGDLDVTATDRDRDVDTDLQQIEHLLSALVRLHPDDITDVDMYDCDDTQQEGLASTAGRLMRDNRSLDLQLSQAIRENTELQLSVEQLESDARRLKEHNFALQDELSHLRASSDNVIAELSEFLPDSGPVDINSIVEALGELKNRSQQLETINNTLKAKLTQLQHTFISKHFELQTKIEQLKAEREALLKQDNELQRAVELSQQVPKTTLPATHDSAKLLSRIDKLEIQLRVQQDAYVAIKLSLQQEQELNRRTEEEKNQLILEIEELQLEAKKTENECDKYRKQLDDRNITIRSANDAAMRTISQPEMATTTDASPINNYFVSQENARLEDKIESLNEAIFHKSEVIQEVDEKIRRRQQQQQHSQNIESGSRTSHVLNRGPRMQEVANISTRLQDQNAALEKATEMRDVRCCNLDEVNMDNKRLSRVVGELRAQLDTKDSDIVRLRANITDLEERLANERHEFCKAVELVRSENAAECDKIAKENHHLTTLLQQLELSYSEKMKSPNESLKVSTCTSYDEFLLESISEYISDNVFGSRQRC